MGDANSIAPTGRGSRTILKATQFTRRVRNKIRPPLPLFRVLNHGKEIFECPICSYNGPFADLRSFGGFRKHALCPNCGAFERHRLQYMVVEEVLRNREARTMAMLHFAPEKYFRPIFSRRFGKYETADLFMNGVDHRVDISSLPFKDEAYDFVYASHVLEYIRDDGKALREIRRVLRPSGLAILPVPVVCASTIEYPEANPFESGHVRSPGTDYFERYKPYFARIATFASDSFPEKHQLFTYEDRTQWPTKECPLRPPMQGERHLDFVPVCYC